MCGITLHKKYGKNLNNTVLLHNKIDYFLRVHICWTCISMVSTRSGIYAIHAQHIYRVLGIEKYTLLKMEVTNKIEQPINGNNQ